MRRRKFLHLAALGGTALAASGLTTACSDRGGGAGAGLPDAEQIMGWIREIVSHGIRRPGYAADQWVEGWAKERFAEIGLEDVHFEPVPLPYYEPLRGELILSDGNRFTGLPMPYAAAGSAAGKLAVLENSQVGGALAVSEMKPLVLPQNALRGLATSYFDPSGEFDTLQQILPFNAAFNSVMDPAIAAGAMGFVGLLTGFPWETRNYYVPYDAVERPIPGIWLSGNDGRALLERMAQGSVEARIEVEANRSPFTSNNVIGTLPGSSDEWVIVGSHHDGPWASAVEDASGTSLVLAQASYWASVSREERPHNMLFLLNAGHMAGGAGLQNFIATHGDMLDEVVLEVHLEHAAKRCNGVDGELVPTDDPEVRWWFTSRNPSLEASVAAAIAAHDLRRSLVLRPNIFFDTPPTDGAFFHSSGVPIAQFLTAPMYLFDAQDTIDKIHQPTLEPLSRAVIQIIEATRGVTAAAMRAGIVKA